MYLLKRITHGPLSVLALGTVVLLSACAQSPAVDPNTGRGSTQDDARRTAQGRETQRAGSQIQLDLNHDASKPAAAATATPAIDSNAALIPEIGEAKTFLGTIPCTAEAKNCVPQKLTITLAPAGQWRLRSQSQNTQGDTLLASGCWASVGLEPRRIILLNEQKTVIADLSFSNQNVVMVNAFNQQRPLLSTSLTRQADIDPIAQISDQASPACR